ncbi:DUF4917 family protein [Rhizobium beringeri]|nr:DUF4917 family protein [Rhizobium beringeri]WSH14336.1 DUF4917 family protein [Rhizobium beringeri]
MPLLTFGEAITDSEQFSKRHLLLGNGFSIACRADTSTTDRSTIKPISPVHLRSRRCSRPYAAMLKEILVQTIAGNHPHIPSDIPEDKFWACRRFLSHFLSGEKAGCVFTLNYDLLLYWTLMHDDLPFGDPIDLAKSDGFGNDEDKPDADYVVWQGETNAHSASVMFLHGALHLFDSGKDLLKYTWVRKGVPLIDQA